MNKSKLKSIIEDSEIVMNYLDVKKNNYVKELQSNFISKSFVRSQINSMKKHVYDNSAFKDSNSSIIYFFLNITSDQINISDDIIKEISKINYKKIIFIVPSNDTETFMIVKDRIIKNFNKPIFWFLPKVHVKNPIFYSREEDQEESQSFPDLFVNNMWEFAQFMAHQWIELSLSHKFVNIYFVNENTQKPIVKVLPYDSPDTNDKNDDHKLNMHFYKKNMTFSKSTQSISFFFILIIQSFYIDYEIFEINKKISKIDDKLKKEQKNYKSKKQQLRSMINEDEIAEIMITRKRDGEVV